MLLQPSSASVERSFSLLKNVFQKAKTKQDLIEITLMLQYNRREKVRKNDHVIDVGDSDSDNSDNDSEA